MNTEDFGEFIEEIQKRNNQLEDMTFKKFATFSKDAIRKPDYSQPTLRSPFCRDGDRIIHSLSFSRSYDKTQVFFWVNSDVFQHRLLHVQLVSKISRYIAKILNLNQDLAESIALGHDIGHTPFGHDGEFYLGKICKEHKIGTFYHNYESVWFIQEIEMQNLTLQTLDGILGHNGELHERKIQPESKKLSWSNLENDMNSLIGLNNATNGDPPNIKPKTMEGSLVRFVDTLSYISRDIRDAELLGITSFKDLPNHIKETLGDSNRAIINTLIRDLIRNSIDNPWISYSEDVSNTLLDLYQFSFERIYTHPKKKKSYDFIEKAFHILWNKFLEDLENDNRESEIFRDHFNFNLLDIKVRYPDIKDISDYPYYAKNIKRPNIIVRDFLAGMTDGFFLKMVSKYAPDLKFEKENI